MMASATARWADDILSSGISAIRSPVSATAEPANSTQIADTRRIVFMESSLNFARSECRTIKRKLLHSG
jgi:hypothetical protein